MIESGESPAILSTQLEQAEYLNEEAAVAEEEGTHARETAEKYIGATVLFALVLFLVAVSQRFRILGVRIGAIAIGLVLLSADFHAGCSAQPSVVMIRRAAGPSVS